MLPILSDVPVSGSPLVALPDPLPPEPPPESPPPPDPDSAMAMSTVVEATPESEPVAVTVYDRVAWAVVGVPEMIPVLGSIDSPAGSPTAE